MLQLRELSAEVQQAVDACLACHEALQLGGPCNDVVDQASHIKLVLDCSLICAMAADLMQRLSPFYQQAAQMCAEACEACARDYLRLAEEAQASLNCDLADCAEVCLRTAVACRRVTQSPQLFVKLAA
jgi:hypothetical protein